MEFALVPISEIYQKGVWHFLPYSLSVRKAETALENSNYPIVPLRDLVCGNLIQRGFPLQSIAYQNEGIPLIRLSNLQSGKIDFLNLVYISQANHDKLQKTQLHQGNVLVGLIIRPMVRVAVYESDQPANINQHIAKLELKQERINPHFLVYYLQTEIAQTLLRYRATGTTQPVISIHSLMELEIPCPPIPVQHKIVNATQIIRQQAEDYQQTAQALQQDVFRQFDNVLWQGGS